MSFNKTQFSSTTNERRRFVCVDLGPLICSSCRAEVQVVTESDVFGRNARQVLLMLVYGTHGPLQ